jgi:hypothetical protein
MVILFGGEPPSGMCPQGLKDSIQSNLKTPYPATIHRFDCQHGKSSVSSLADGLSAFGMQGIVITLAICPLSSTELARTGSIVLPLN